jgi:hypothetical protein
MDARVPQFPVVPGLFGIGQGYSLSASDGFIQAEKSFGAKSDSVGLYLKQTANKVLGQLIPGKKIKYV